MLCGLICMIKKKKEKYGKAFALPQEEKNMSEFHIPEVPQSTSFADRSFSVNKAIARSYIWMFAGLVISAISSWFIIATNLLYSMGGILAGVLLIAQLVTVVGFSAAMYSSSATTLKVMFIIYSALTGVTIASLTEMYSAGTIYVAFAISAFYFGCLAVIGFTTNKDLTKMGTICTIGLFALIISQLIMLLFRTPMSIRLYSIVGLIMFTGLTAWDTSRLNKVMTMTDGNPVEQEKYSIFFALELYLDFVNIFLYIVRLLGMGSSSSSKN